MICPACGTAQPAIARFCGRCGELLAAVRPEDGARAPPDRWRVWSRVAAGTAALVAVTGAFLLVPAGGSDPQPADDVVIPVDVARGSPSPTPSPSVSAAPAIVAGATTSCATVEQVASFDCPRWRVPARDVTAVPVIDRGDVFVGTVDQLIALDAVTGQIRWSVDLGGPVLHRPAVGEGAVFVVDGRGHLTAIDRATGEPGWTRHAHSLVAPILAGETVALATVGAVRGHDVSDGSERWTVEVSGAPSPLAGSGDHLFVADADGEVRAIHAATGVTDWRAAAAGRSVTVHEDRGAVVVSGLSGPLVALDHRTGERLWTSDVEIGWARPHARLGDGRLHVVHDGRLLAVAAADGEGATVAEVGAASSLAVGPQGLLYVLGVDGKVSTWTTGGVEVRSPALAGHVSELALGMADGAAWMVAIEADRTRLVGLPAPPPPNS